MKGRDVRNAALHLTIGGALAALAAWNIWMIVPVTFIWASLREQAQHRYEIKAFTFDTPEEGRYYRVTKRTFFDFGWLGWQQVGEIIQWTVGAAIGCGILEFRLWEILG